VHIVLVTPAYLPLPGGGERYVGALARGLARQGHPVTVITSAATAEADLWSGTPTKRLIESVADGIRVVRCPIRSFPGGRRGLMMWRKAMVVISSLPGDQTAILSRMAAGIPPVTGMDDALDALTDVDLVHAFNLSWERGLVAALRYAVRAGIPYVVTPFAHFGTGEGDRVARNSTMDHQLTILRQASRVLVLTSVEQADLAKYNISPERIIVIGGGVDSLPATDMKEASTPTFHLDLPPIYGVFIGRLSFDKGAIHAAEAIRVLHRSGREVALILAGSATPEFSRYYDKLPESDRQLVRPIGLIGEVEKYRLLAGSRFLMLPSRSDSFGIVMLEAWACGVPVIAARAGGIPGVVDDGENGLLVSFGDVTGLAAAVERLLADPAEAIHMGENGRRKVADQYNWESVTERLSSHYTAILTGR